MGPIHTRVLQRGSTRGRSTTLRDCSHSVLAVFAQVAGLAAHPAGLLGLARVGVSALTLALAPLLLPTRVGRVTLLPAVVTLGTGLPAVPSFSPCPAVLLGVTHLAALRAFLALTALSALAALATLATFALTHGANVHWLWRLLSTDHGSGDGQDLLTEVGPRAEHVNSHQ